MIVIAKKVDNSKYNDKDVRPNIYFPTLLATTRI